MASCNKCGARIKRRQPLGGRKCTHCGYQPGVSARNRSGIETPKPIPRAVQAIDKKTRA